MHKKLMFNNSKVVDGIDTRLKVKYITTRPEFMNTFNDDFVYETKTIDNYDGTYTIEVYSDDDFTSIKFGSNCYAITSIEHLAITNKVTTMSGLFNVFYNLVSIKGIDKWDTSSVTSMQSMFQSCELLTSVDVSNFDTSKVTTMAYMFSDCSSLEEIKGIEYLDVSATQMFGNMFSDCSSLTSLDLSSWNITRVNPAGLGATGMFSGCSSLTSLDISTFPLKGNSSSMFRKCKNLSDLKLPKTYNSYVSGCNISYMFQGCSSLTSLDLSGWSCNPRNTHFVSTFYGCSSLEEIKGIENWDVSKVTSLEYTFSNCLSLTSLDLSSWDVSKVTNMSNTFYNCPSLTSLGDISNWWVNNVTNMWSLFGYCSSLELPTLHNWDTSNVTNMSEMFAGRSNQSINSLVIENWNTSSVTDMSWMFYGCTNNWYDLHLNWDTYNVTNMSNMFKGFYGVQDIYINNWYTNSYLEDVTDMFLDCQASSIHVSSDFRYTEEDTGYSGYFIR